MTPRRRSNAFRITTGLAVLLASLLFVGHGPMAQEPVPAGVYSGGLFQLGDGQPPPGYAGMADILLNGAQPGPDWAALFNADGSLRDDHPADANGQPLGNGVPDYQELYGGQWAVFTRDDVSLGTGFEGSALVGEDGLVYNATATPEHDVGNAYVYSTFDSAGNLVLYAGAERLGAGDSFLEFEFNQAHIRLGYGPPWEITGGRTAGDLRVRVDFAGGGIVGVAVDAWAEDAPGSSGFAPLTGLAAEGCDPGETACAVCNQASIDGGPWPNFDTAGDPEQISPERFLELGVNVGALLGLQPDYTSIQIRTPQDIAFGYFAEGN